MTRDEHLASAKEKALEYLNRGDPWQAMTSMLVDLAQHSDLENHPSINIGIMYLVTGKSRDAGEVRDWIEGFR